MKLKTILLPLVNILKQLKSAGKKRSISGFNDPLISNGKVLIDLVDAVTPGSINYCHVKEASTDEVASNDE